jgi:hypothetical protein
MRSSVFFVVMMCAPAWAQAPADKAANDPQSDAARAARAAEIVKKAAEQYTITRGVEKEPLKLEPKSLLPWSNPVVGSIHGGVFIWTERGRPEVIASIYKFSSPLHHVGVEFHSLAREPLTAERDGQPAWIVPQPGIEFKPIPGAPVPADSPARRLSQMRALSKEFSATETTREEPPKPGIARDLRLLTQPLYRYASTDPEKEVLDGALFTFVLGTDTEIFLIIEARRSGESYVWNYALARMNSIVFHVNHSGREVWTTTELPWAVVGDGRHPYNLFTFQPGEGANPPGESRDPFAR